MTKNIKLLEICKQFILLLFLKVIIIIKIKIGVKSFKFNKTRK
jgi:hypothetical protein